MLEAQRRIAGPWIASIARRAGAAARRSAARAVARLRGARPPDRAALGRAGERLAARRLRRLGYRIVARNLRIGRDEADLVARDPEGIVVLVEVRTRRRGGRAAEASLGTAKRRALGRLALRLRNRLRPGERGVRIDLVAIDWPSRGAPQLRLHRGLRLRRYSGP